MADQKPVPIRFPAEWEQRFRELQDEFGTLDERQARRGEMTREEWFRGQAEYARRRGLLWREMFDAAETPAVINVLIDASGDQRRLADEYDRYAAEAAAAATTNPEGKPRG